MNFTGFAQTAKGNWQMIKKIILYLILILSIVSCDLPSDNSEIHSRTEENDAEKSFEKAKFIYAHDGDTIRVKLGGREEKIRFVGVNTPEVAKDGKPAQFMADDAKDFTEEILSNKEIYLEIDISDRDKYDRLLRYIWLEEPIENPSIDDVGSKTLNGILVKEGYAYANYYKPDVKYHNYLKDLENSAQDKNLGIWSKKSTDEKELSDKPYLIKGNKNSKVYHLPEWDSYEMVKEKNAVYFQTEKEARDAGFRPAK